MYVLLRDSHCQKAHDSISGVPNSHVFTCLTDIYSENCKFISFCRFFHHNRKGFGEKGPMEMASEQFLEAAKKGDLDLVRDMLHAGKVHVDVADINGNTALIAAAVRPSVRFF